MRAVEEHARLARRALSTDVTAVAQPERRGAVAKRDLSLRSNGTIDTWYGCFIYDEMVEYALNYTFPWSESSTACCGEMLAHLLQMLRATLRPGKGSM